MTAHASNQLSMADVRNKLIKSNAFTERKRRRIDNSLNSLWRYSGIPLENIPATMPGLTAVVSKIEPAAHCIGRPTIINMRNHVMHALKHTGAVPELEGYRERRKPLSPAWQLVFKRIDGLNQKASLWSFIHYLNEKDIAPRQVRDEDLQRFSEYLKATSPRPDQHNLIRQIATKWNNISGQAPDIGLLSLAKPASRLRRLPHSMSDFPQSFQQSVEKYAHWLARSDVFDEHSRRRKLAQSTIGNYLRRIHRFASHLAVSGVAISDFKDLSILIDLKNFKTIVHSLQASDKSAQQAETFHSSLTLLQIARWLKISDDKLEKLSRQQKQVPFPKMTMTKKNKKLVSQFDDPAVYKRLVEAPGTIWKKMLQDKRMGARSRLAHAQAALGLAILTSMPLRLANLTNLKLGEHILLRPGGVSSLIISAEEMKAQQAIEFDIPPAIATMLTEYFAVIIPKAAGTNLVSLFSRADGGAKGFAQVRYLVQTYFKEYVGFHMNPHAFRHLSAKIILDANPGAHALVQELLGHQSIETSTAFYAGISSRRAGRHHQHLIADFIAKQPPAPFNRRRKAGR